MSISDARYRRKPQVIEADLGSELVLLDPATQQMFGLNATGRQAWRELHERSAADLVASICRTYAVAPADAERDLTALLDELIANGLIARD